MKSKLLVLGTIALLIGISIARRPSLPEREQAQTVLVETETGWGSAVTIKRGGMCFAWTAAHVVKNDAKVKVHKIFRYQGHKAGEYLCEGHVLKLLPHQDAALILIDGDPAQFTDATFCRLPSKPGEKITHVGNALGPQFDTSFEAGVVSQNGVKIESEDCLLDQGSFAVAPGCSGGPVFSAYGNVIGLAVVYAGPGISLYVPTRILESAAESENLGWAVRGYSRPPTKRILRLVADREKEVADKPPVNLLELLFGGPPEKK